MKLKVHPSLVARHTLLAASRSASLRRFAMTQGMRFGAARFVAGPSLDDFVRVARARNEAGMLVTAGYLGEGVHDAASAQQITADFTEIFNRIAQEGLRSTVALKLTHLGLAFDPRLAYDNVRTIARRAKELGNFLRIDMEESWYVDATLAIYRRLRDEGLDNVGVVLQAYLRRTEDDLHDLASLGANVRLVKGAYLEAPSVAYTGKAEIDAQFSRLIETALQRLPFTAIATHDDAVIERAIAFAQEQSIAPNRFEFQALFGVREPLQRDLVARGFPLRISVPFGQDWYPYLMRRLAEKPSNLALVARSLFTKT